MGKISFFKSLLTKEAQQEIDFLTFFENVRTGAWQDAVLKVRCEKDKQKRNELKKKLPAVTISGVFTDRKISGLQKHSGLLAIDIDDLNENIQKTEEILRKDKYTYALFRSVSGQGLCVVVKIQANKHSESFSGLSLYYFNNYQIVIDSSCKDVSRARIVSYDPDAFLNPHSLVFKEYVKNFNAEERKFKDFVINTQSNFEFVLSQIVNNRINICNSYEEWLKIGFAIASEFGAGGFQYFKEISQISAMYRPDSQAASPQKVEKQYNYCLKSSKSGITIKTFYYFAKKAGCLLHKPNERKYIDTAYALKKSNKSEAEIKNQIAKQFNISEQEAQDITNKVMQLTDEAFKNADNTIVLEYIKANYNIRYNLITEQIEIDEQPATERKLNTIYNECVKIKPIRYENFARLINSELIPSYNPFTEYFSQNTETFDNEIQKLLECFNFPINKNFYEKILTKWLIGLVGGAFNKPANFCVVLVSEKTQIGKTLFFRNLLPEKLKKYKVEINFDNTNKKDDLVPLTQNLLVLVDEWQDVANKNADRLRWIITADSFDFRKVYRKDEAKYKRYASIAGTSNPLEIINDSEYNRRIIPVLVDNIDLDVFLALDKDKLFAELYDLYKNNFEYELTQEDVKELKETQTAFEISKFEKELLLNVVQKPESHEDAEFYTTSEILNAFVTKYPHLKQVSTKSIGQALRYHSFERVVKRILGKPVWGYLCKPF